MLLTRYDAGQRFPHRWWFPEFYKDYPVPELLGKLLTPEGLQAVWNYLYARDIGQPLGSSDAAVYYPRGSSGDLGAGLPGNAPAGQATQTVPRPAAFTADLSIGQRGAAPGGLLAPKGEVQAVRRRYRDGSLVLETEFETAEGVVAVVDCMPGSRTLCASASPVARRHP